MNYLRFTLPPGQQRTPLIGAGVLLLIAILSGSTGSMGLAVPVTVIAIVLLVIYFSVMFGSFSVFDEHGIRSRRGVFRNEVAWENVHAVRPDPKSGQVLMVYRTDGKPFKVGAPISGGVSTDPEYRAKVDRIMEYAQPRIG